MEKNMKIEHDTGLDVIARFVDEKYVKPLAYRWWEIQVADIHANIYLYFNKEECRLAVSNIHPGKGWTMGLQRLLPSWGLEKCEEEIRYQIWKLPILVLGLDEKNIVNFPNLS